MQIGTTKEIPIKKAGNLYVFDHQDVVRCNTKAHTPWAAKITGPDSKYKFVREWLKKAFVNNYQYLAISGFGEGDTLNFNGGSWKNKYPTYVRILEINTEKETMTVKYIDEVEVLEIFNASPILTDAKPKSKED